MRKKKFNLVDVKTNEVVFSGTYEMCKERLKYRIEYTGEELEPHYKATTDNSNVEHIGSMEHLAKIYNTSKINLYNYTRYKRKKDGLFLMRVN